MDFSLSDEQKMLVQSAEQFRKKDSPVERFRNLRGDERGWEPKVWQQMGELGWLAIPFAEDVGGFGGDLVDAMLICEQLGRSLIPEPYVPSVIAAGMTIAQAGTDGQKESALTPMIEGQISLALAHTERESRYDLTLISMSAKESGGEFTLEGEKIWVPNGHAADKLLVAARTSGKPGEKAGITLFLVDGDARGLTRQAVNGMDSHRTGLLTFKGVKVGKDAVVGEVGKGFDLLEAAVDRAAAMAVAEGIGLARECLERTIEYLKVRQQFGIPIGAFQALQHRAADMFAETEQIHSAAILAAIMASGDDAVERKRAVSAAKAQLTESGWFVVKYAIQLHGGIGCTDEQDIGLFFKRMRCLHTLWGDRDWHVGRYASLEGFEYSKDAA